MSACEKRSVGREKKIKQSWCWKNWDVNRDAEVSHDAADRRCEAAAAGGGDDAPVKIINHAWHRCSRLTRQRGVGGLSPANHTPPGAIANLSIRVATEAPQIEKNPTAARVTFWRNLRLSEIIFLRKGEAGRRRCWCGPLHCKGLHFVF